MSPISCGVALDVDESSLSDLEAIEELSNLDLSQSPTELEKN